MSKWKIMALVALITFAFATVGIGNAVAGEKVKGRNAKHTTRWEQIEVGDEEGHVVGIYEAKGIVSRTDGKTFVTWECGLLDMNLKTGLGSGTGHGVTTDRDGDKMHWTWKGKTVKPGIWEGTLAYVKGTGKYEGIKGKGTYTNYTIAPRQNYADFEMEEELPSR